jgi:micrococcal nuclease
MTLLAVGLVVLIGVGGNLVGGSASRPRPTPSPAPSASEEVDLPEGERRGPFTVLRVLDGATALVEEVPGRATTVRLLGVDAPVLSEQGLQMNCLAASATGALRSMVEGRVVRLERDPSQPPHDAAGASLAYVYVDGALINQIVVQGGYATEYAAIRPYRHEGRLRVAEQSARDEGLGVWSPGRCAAP